MPELRPRSDRRAGPDLRNLPDIASGQDVDVIEIDGASNNGVESVRELRQNAGLRPSRARFKIYYIDEVHMLSTGAFNALLKTLEEPPPHVKFFFATTEANKIPITVLSRCQRYDLAAISPESWRRSSPKICASEGVEADAEALRIVARRASGSMRDAESLLEQLLSGGPRNLTAEGVHRALGTRPDDRVLGLLDALADRDVGKTLEAIEAGVGVGRPAGRHPGGGPRLPPGSDGPLGRGGRGEPRGVALAAPRLRELARPDVARHDPRGAPDPLGGPAEAPGEPSRADDRRDRRWRGSPGWRTWPRSATLITRLRRSTADPGGPPP